MSSRSPIWAKLLSGVLAALIVPIGLYGGATSFPSSPVNLAPVGDLKLSIWFFGLGWLVSALFVVIVFVPVSLAVDAFARPRGRAAVFAVAACALSIAAGFLLADTALGFAIIGGLGFGAMMLASTLERLFSRDLVR